MPRRAELASRAETAEQPIWPALTLEVFLYALIVAGAVFVRFYALGRWPLLNEEASQALAAWRFLQGQGASSSSVPLLFDGALVSFFAFGASDGAARLLPAALGAAVVLVPVALRRRLGSWGALAASFGLAFSPIMVFYSRTLAGPAPALAGLGALLVAIEWASQGQEQRATVLGAVGLAVGLTSSPWVYTFLLAALLFYGLGWLRTRRGTVWAGWAAGQKTLHRALSDRRAWSGLALLVVPISLGMLLNWGGLQATANLLATWLGRLVPGSGGRSWGYTLQVLAFYESATLVLGLAGLVIGLRRQSSWAGFLGLWAVVAIFLASISGARDGAPVALALLPLTLLAGLAVSEVVARLRAAQWAWVGGCLFVFAAVLGFWWIQLAAYSNADLQTALSADLTVVGLLTLATPLLLVATGLVFWFWVGRAETAWAVVLLGLGLAACLIVRQSVNLNFIYARDAREPLLAAPSSVDLNDMVAFLEDWSARKALDQHALTIEVASNLGPLVPWYLRDFPVRVLPSPGADDGAGALVLAAQPEKAALPGYVGQRYQLLTTSDTPLGSFREGLSWWLLRTGGGPVQRQACELWVKP